MLIKFLYCVKDLVKEPFLSLHLKTDTMKATKQLIKRTLFVFKNASKSVSQDDTANVTKQDTTISFGQGMH